MMPRCRRLLGISTGLGGATAIASGVAMVAGGAENSASCDSVSNVQMQRASLDTRLSTVLTTVTTGASIAAAAAPTLCAVHCAAMPFAAVLMPSLQAVGGGKLFGGMCMHAFGRKLAYYFVIPCGLLSNAVGYPQHQSIAVTATSLSGVATMTAAAAGPARLIGPYRTFMNLSGCAMMLSSSYFGNKIAAAAGRGCSSGGCCDGDLPLLATREESAAAKTKCSSTRGDGCCGAPPPEADKSSAKGGSCSSGCC